MDEIDPFLCFAIEIRQSTPIYNLKLFHAEHQVSYTYAKKIKICGFMRFRG